MILSNITEKQLYTALKKINKRYKGNVIFNRIEALSATRKRWAVTLRVKDSHGKGARLGYYKNANGNRRHLINACWHAHGDFFEALPDDAIIRSRGVIINKHSWHDWNAGSIMEPASMSDLCDCER